MTKKILALVLALTMAVSLTTVMAAGGAAGGGVGGEGGIVLEPAGIVKTLVFPAKILVKVAGEADEAYADELTLTTSKTGNIPAFDFKAYVDTALLLTNINEQLDGDSSLLDDEVTGDVELTLTVPANMTASVDNVEVVTNELFTATTAIDDVENELKVTLSVIEGKTVADLMGAVETSVVEITCTDVEVSAFGTYEITGHADGALDIGGLLTVDCVLGPIGEDSMVAKVVASKTTGGGGSSDRVDYPYEDKEEDPTPVDPTPVTPPAEEGFTDVKGHWAEEAINFVVEKNLFKGTSATTFSPNASTTRGMIAVVLHNYEENPVHDYAGDFVDVEHNQWYTEGIAWLSATGVTTGYPDGRFGHSDNVTREQLAAFLYRFAAHKGYDVAIDEIELDYADADAISAYAEEAIKWATANGIMNGKDGGKLDPKGFATRAEVAAMMQRFVLKYNI